MGLGLGLERSRLARRSPDGHPVFEGCALCGPRLAEQEGVYDASDPHERLLCGFQGTRREVALQTMRQRLERGRLHTAHRGARFHGVPMGDVRLPTGAVDVDPDAPARAVLPLLFAQLDRRGALSGVWHSLVRQHIGLPRRARTGPQTGQVPWRRPSVATRSQVCHPPL